MAFVIASLAVGRAVGGDLPDGLAIMAEPHDRQATLAEPVELRNATLTVTKVTLADALTDDLELSVTDTPGVFVLVELTSAARQRNRGPDLISIASADGTRVWERTRAIDTCVATQAGLVQKCSMAVELPPAELAGTQLRISTTGFDDRFDDRLVLDLGLVPSDAERAWSLYRVPARTVHAAQPKTPDE